MTEAKSGPIGSAGGVCGIPEGWYARANGKRSDVPGNTILDYLRHRRILVLSSDSEQQKTCSCSTQLFLRLTGPVGLALIVRAPKNQVNAFFQQQQQEKGDALVAVMPFGGALFDEFVSVMNECTTSLQRMLLRCKLADMMCISDREHEASIIMEDVKLAANRMIDASCATEGVDAVPLCTTQDPLSGPGYWWSRQVIGQISDGSGSLDIFTLQDILADDDDEDRGGGGGSSAVITQVSCASRSWFAGLVEMSARCKHKHIIPPVKSIKFLGPDDHIDPQKPLLAYSYVDLDRIKDECLAFLSIFRHFSTYQHQEQIAACLKILCSHPIIAQCLVIDPASVMDLLVAAKGSSSSLNLMMLSQMVSMCAKVEIDNYVQLGLPVTLTSSVWLALHHMHKLFPLALRSPHDSVELLNEFMGAGGYLSELDLSSSIITGSAITFSTIITAHHWMRVSKHEAFAHAMHKSLYPCIYTNPTAEKSYKEIVQQYAQLADHRTDSHRIISVIVRPSPLMEKIGPWKWTSDDRSSAAATATSFQKFAKDKVTDVKFYDDEKEVQGPSKRRGCPHGKKKKRRHHSHNDRKLWLWTDIPLHDEHDSDDVSPDSPTSRSRSVSPRRDHLDIEVTGTRAPIIGTLTQQRPQRPLTPVHHHTWPPPPSATVSLYNCMDHPPPCAGPLMRPPTYVRQHLIGGPDRQLYPQLHPALPPQSQPSSSSSSSASTAGPRPASSAAAAEVLPTVSSAAAALAAASAASAAEEKNRTLGVAAATEEKKRTPITAGVAAEEKKRTLGVADSENVQNERSYSEAAKGGLVDLGNLTLDDVLSAIQVDWTLIDGPSIHSCKFSPSVGADLQIMVTSGANSVGLERTALQHYAKIRDRCPNARILRQTAVSLCYWIIDPSNLKGFRIVRIYSGTCQDIVTSPVGMTRAGYSQPTGFFGTPSFVCSAIHSRSPNYSLSNAKHPHEFLFKYRMRGFSWPETVTVQDGKSKSNALIALQTWGKAQPDWKHYDTKQAIPTGHPAMFGFGRFNFDTIL